MKKFLSLFLIFLSLTMAIPAYAKTGVEATVTSSSVYVNGRYVLLNGFVISGNSYFKLSSLAEALSGTSSQFDVFWNGKRNAIEIITGKPYAPDESNTYKYYYPGKSYTAFPSTSKIFVDGIEQSITAYIIDGSSYFRLRDLGKLIPFDVEWDGENNRILIFTKTPDNAYRVKTAFGAYPDNTVSSNFPRWSSTIMSYLIDNKDGTISVLEAKWDKITIEKYDQQYNLISQQSVDYELPIFGGFYSGEKYNYIAYGQSNFEEDDDKEVIRVVRYDKTFQRVDSVSVYGDQCFTIHPFQAGSGKMAEHGKTLVFHTSRKRYTTADGLNHQSQLTLIIDTEIMRVINNSGEFQSNHVSHSFDQYVQFDGSDHVLVDHGDAYPRSVVLHKANDMGLGRFTYDDVDLFTIPGETGANCTGVSIGGFEISSDSYIVAMNSIDHSLVTEYTNFIMKGLGLDQRDIIICSLPKDKLDENHVKQTILAQYSGSEKIGSIPQLVKISDDKMMVLWQEFNINGQPEAVKYVFIDGNGEPCSEVEILKNFRLSRCKPIVFRNSVVWYTNEYGLRYFYSIPLTDTGLYPLDTSPTQILTPTPVPTPLPVPTATAAPTSVPSDVVNVRGNTAGNIINDGIAAMQEDWIYYRNENDYGLIYKIRSDGSDRTNLNDNDVGFIITESKIRGYYINVVDDWIYYSNGLDGLYKVRTDGSGKTKISDDWCLFVNVVGEWIYYSNADDNYNIYKIRTDGSSKTKINYDGCFYKPFLNVVGDWIYYINKNNRRIYKMRTDGSERTSINDDVSEYINVVGEWIYYSNLNDGSRIYKIRIDGSGRTKINNDMSYSINVAGDWIYYINENDNNKLYKIRIDGRGRTKINDDHSFRINVVGDWIYYINGDDNDRLYKIRIDGSGRTTVE